MALRAVSFKDLFLELPFGQRAPFGLALVWKGLLALQADGRHLLRLPALVAGIAQLPLFWAATKGLDQGQKAPVAVLWIMAVAPNLILFGSQVKPYVFDVFFSTLLLYLARPFLLPGWPGPGRAIALFAGVWISLFFSYPSWFVAAGLCCALFIHNGFKRPWLWGGLGLGSLLIVLFIWSGSGQTGDFLQTFWAEGYPRAAGWWWFMALAQSLFGGLSSPTFLATKDLFYLFGWLYLPLCVFAFLRLRRQKRYGLLGLLLLPSLFCLAAAALHAYPYRGRLILFMMPQIHLLLAWGLPGLASRPGPTLSRPGFQRIALWGMAALILLCGGVSLAEYAYPCQGVRSGLELIARQEQEGDLIIVDEYAAQVVNYYGSLRSGGEPGRFPESRLIIPWDDETSQVGKKEPARVAESLPPGSRVWVIAEAAGYHRRLRADFRPDTMKLVEVLSRSRNMVQRLLVPRLMVICFSPEKPG